MTRTATRRPRYRVIEDGRGYSHEPFYSVSFGARLIARCFSRSMARRIVRLLNASPRATRKQK